ncbi:hypothetical protein BDW02DRAFT_316532 [Decorospora gaudefroyi]|uniref:DNA/RNA-binding domain-containing protein n=1 Tax=Decorospora gaudefroyi TaxID=184978 RepID=A0A6A5KGS2_9PLEO|nr:hypothetical protein BDW02DRAFT_316532 [Decorospora gaudefroyi]
MDHPEIYTSGFAQALMNQKTQAEYAVTGALSCPFPSNAPGHDGRIFQGFQQLYSHVQADHGSEPAIRNLGPGEAHAKLKEIMLKLSSDQSSIATAGDRSTPDIAGLTLEPLKGSRQSSPPLGRKRPAAEHEFTGRKGKAPSYVETADPDNSIHIPYTIGPDRTKPRSQDPGLVEPKQSARGASSPYQTTPEASSEWSAEVNKSGHFQSSQPQSHARQPALGTIHKPSNPQRQPGLIELQRRDPRYPELLLQPDSRPISQEQLATEVKSIYSGLTMLENRCINVDRSQAAAAHENCNTKLPSDHWQALIVLHRTLLHEHHDFFLASQHPSASPALRRLAAKYSMPARMWKHGIHSFLELLRRSLPDSIDYMLAFIYSAYQMMALLYETVPAFEDTWIECLGDLGRYRMAIEDEDVRDRETWAGVARSWYTKAADKNPTVGRLYHHLAILARPNILQQMYYYSRSLTCVKPFGSARESIMTLLDPILGRAMPTYSHALPIDTNFIKAHALQFEHASIKKREPELKPEARSAEEEALAKEFENKPVHIFKPTEEFLDTCREFTGSLDNHIGRVTAKWKEQGVYVAVTNIAGWFGYGEDRNILRQAFLTQLQQKAQNSISKAGGDNLRTASPADQEDPTPPVIPADKIEGAVKVFALDSLLGNARDMTKETFAIVLRRIGDKNVLPHVHIMLSFVNALAPYTYAPILLQGMPWAELVAFLNTLVKTENQLATPSNSQPHNIDTLLAANVFPAEGERSDELPLPEDYLVRGQIWAHNHFPKKWFEREHDEEERYLELASTAKNRMERVLRLGYQLTKHHNWITYDKEVRVFAIPSPESVPKLPQ